MWYCNICVDTPLNLGKWKLLLFVPVIVIDDPDDTDDGLMLVIDGVSSADH